MRHTTISFFYPKPENKQQFLDGCVKVAEFVRSQPGIVETGAWFDSERDRIVIMSLWESHEAAVAARPSIGPAVASIPFRHWERQQPEQLANLTRVA